MHWFFILRPSLSLTGSGDWSCLETFPLGSRCAVEEPAGGQKSSPPRWSSIVCLTWWSNTRQSYLEQRLCSFNSCSTKGQGLVMWLWKVSVLLSCEVNSSHSKLTPRYQPQDHPLLCRSRFLIAGTLCIQQSRLKSLWDQPLISPGQNHFIFP